MDDSGADVVPALPIRTRVAGGATLSQGLVLTTPDNSKVGSLKKWSDYATPINLPATPAGFPTPMPRSPAQYYEKTPTPMDSNPYAQYGQGFGLPVNGFGLPGMVMQAGIQNGSTMQTQFTQQPQMVMQQPYQMDAAQQMMYMSMPSMMQQTIQQPTIISSNAGAPVQVSQGPGQQMVMMMSVPMMAQDQAPVSPPDKLNAQDAGRQIFSEAMDATTFEVDDNKAIMLQASVQGASLNGPLPSPGSALHGTGRCNPCAWFWKPKGCLNAVNCSYCHLCPEGELKQRKKSKVVAMRMGALEPSQQSGLPPQIKLSAMLDQN